VVESYDLRTDVPRGSDPGELIEIMRRDKKADAQGLTFVLDGPRGIEAVQGVPEGVVAEVLAKAAG
jgi:5-deoxy-5-amino-3-dehydroquinate synthase